MDAYECILKRRSVRSYVEESVPDEIVEKILDAAKYAPTAANRQEWAFVIVRSKETKQKLLGAAVEIEMSQYTMRRRVDAGGSQLKPMADTLSKMTGRTITPENIREQKDLSELLEKFTKIGVTNLFKAGLIIAVYRNLVEQFLPTTSGVYDIGAAIQNMLLAATNFGLGSLWAGGFSRKESKIEWKPVEMSVRPFYRDRISEILNAPKDMELVALIFIGKTESRPTPPPKKQFKEFVYAEKYGNPWKT